MLLTRHCLYFSKATVAKAFLTAIAKVQRLLSITVCLLREYAVLPFFETVLQSGAMFTEEM